MKHEPWRQTVSDARHVTPPNESTSKTRLMWIHKGCLRKWCTQTHTLIQNWRENQKALKSFFKKANQFGMRWACAAVGELQGSAKVVRIPGKERCWEEVATAEAMGQEDTLSDKDISQAEEVEMTPESEWCCMYHVLSLQEELYNRESKDPTLCWELWAHLFCSCPSFTANWTHWVIMGLCQVLWVLFLFLDLMLPWLVAPLGYRKASDGNLQLQKFWYSNASTCVKPWPSVGFFCRHGTIWTHIGGLYVSIFKIRCLMSVPAKDLMPSNAFGSPQI